MQKPGLRILKSAVAVFLCFVADMLRPGGGMPFYSAIAAVLCMQTYVGSSIAAAANRTLATFIGGFAGFLLLLAERQLWPAIPLIVHYFFVSLCIIPLIHLTVVMKKETASYITCVVFLSVVITHSSDVSPLVFTLNRMLDTLIGIFLSLLVNLVHMPGPKNSSVLFVSDMDGTLLNSRGRLSSRTRVCLNRLIADGAQFSVASARTPATLVPILEDVHITLPIIVIGGAAMYDIRQQKYLNCKNIPYPIARQVFGVFKENSRGCFAHIIRENKLFIYYDKFHNTAEEKFCQARMNLPLKTYINAAPPVGDDIIYITAIDEKETVDKLYHAVMAMPCSDALGALVYDDGGEEGYYMLEIFSVEVSKQRALQELKLACGLHKTVTFGDNLNDISMLKSADYGFAMKNANERLFEVTSLVTDRDNDHDAVVRTMSRLFRSRTFFLPKEPQEK